MNTQPGDNASAGCPQAGNIGAYLLNALPGSERLEFEKHLSECPACAGATAALRTAVDRMREIPGKPAGRDMTPDILARLPADAWMQGRRPAPSPVLFHALLKIAATVLMAAGIGALSLLVLSRWHSHPIPIAMQAPAERAIDGARASHPGSVSARPLAAAVKDALAWLQRTQDANGGWATGISDSQNTYAPGVSALALMAFMDNTPDVFNGPYAETVRRGINHLVSQQNAEGAIGPRFSGENYNQGLAVRAILEACALETNRAWQTAAERGVSFICKAQTEAGGWGYVRASPNSDIISVSIWPLQALIRADALGHPGLRPRIDQGLDWLKNLTSANGQMGYDRPDDFPYTAGTMTAAGVLCCLMDNREFRPPAVRSMITAVQRAAAEQNERLDYYRFFFLAAALDLSNDPQSRQLMEALRVQVAALQTRDGVETGSWHANDRWGAIGGPVYATAMAALALRATDT